MSCSLSQCICKREVSKPGRGKKKKKERKKKKWDPKLLQEQKHLCNHEFKSSAENTSLPLFTTRTQEQKWKLRWYFTFDSKFK